MESQTLTCYAELLLSVVVGVVERKLIKIQRRRVRRMIRHEAYGPPRTGVKKGVPQKLEDGKSY